jgi:hypothetical protein
MRGHGTMLTSIRLKNTKIMKKINLFFILLISLLSSINAQNNGSVKGIVVDQEFGDGLFGANVFVSGTARGAATDINGEYSINEIAPGIYTITFSMIGF